MKKLYLLAIIIVGAGLVLSIPLFNLQLASAGSIKKIQFTQTITSSPDPGIGHGNEQMALVLSPESGYVYHGSITYSSSQPVQVIILHEIPKSESKGQPTWTVDGNTIYAVTIIDSSSNSGSMDFTGAALALHSTNSTQFTVTTSVDGWIRVPSQIIVKPPVIPTQNYTLRIPQSNIPVTIPMHQGIVDGKTAYYIITDSSNKLVANSISAKQNWKIQPAPLLARIPSQSYGNIFVFTNGIVGNGTRGFQNDILSFTPSNTQYSPLSKIVEVSWNIGRGPLYLNSTKAVLDANMTGKVKLTVTDTILNTPQITWDGGSLYMRENKTLSDTSLYSDGQVLDIDKSNMTVTFIGHRSWGPDGKTAYYIITSATPEGPSKAMKIQNTPLLSTLESSARDLYHFSNGITSSGLLGYQEAISSTQPGDQTYSPICKVSLVSWTDPLHAKLLQNIDDVNSEKSSNTITVQQASVAGDKYILDCPIIDNQ